MNHIYRLIWNQALGALVPVAEITRAKGGCGASQRSSTRPRLAPLSGALLLALGLAAPGAVLAAASISTAQGGSTLTQSVTQAVVAPPAHPLPIGGQVVSGRATIGQSGNTLTINQGSQNAILNWQSFDIGADQTVTFNQPNSASVALNRVLGSDPSAIYGHLNANGQVFLVNPNGIYFARGAQVDVGGLVASTLDITNQDFLNGKYHFAGASTAGVRNDGSIHAATGGYVAFISANVSNNGSIATPEGTTALGTGGSVNLTLAGNSLLSFQVNSSALNALVANGGLIQANGGTVILSAQAKDALLQTVVNNTGQIQAQTVANHHGTIELLGGNSGTVQVAGTLDASAPNGGNGGFIETSGAHVKVADGSTLTTKAPQGNNGTWLIDPQDFTIAASGGDMTGATLSTSLGSGNVTIQSSSGGTAGNGDIFVNDTVAWSTNTLTLNAYRDIVVNTVMNGSGTAGLALEYGQGSASGVINGVASDYIVHAPINLASTGSFSTKLGSSGSTINYTIITSLGTAGDASTVPSTMTLQGVTGGSMSGNYVLGANIDASATATWSPDGYGGYYGFDPIGDGNGGATFTGRFDGLGHTVSNLTTVAHLAFAASLFGYTSNSTIRNIGMVNANVTGIRYAGGLVGYAIGGSIDNAYATGTVKTTSTNDSVGGLVGVNSGTINNAYATASVSGSTNVGGLVGRNSGTINNAYATGNVSGVSEVGGLVGLNLGSSISNAYATGDVTGTAIRIGGLVGFSSNTAISNAYATGNVSGGSIVGGLLGFAYNSTVSNVYATGAVSGSSTVGGLVGSNGGGTITNGYWDITTTGKGTNAGYGTLSGTVTGGGGLTTAQLAAALPSGFASSNWGNAGNQTTPYLLANTSFGTDSGSVIFGSDTSATPTYFEVIANVTQLQNINSTGLGLNYLLGNNIDASATASWNGGAGFAPLGSNANPYQGIFDGLDYTISNLSINRNGSYIGLFGDSGGTIRNIGLVGGSVSGDASSYAVGALAGGNAGTISNAYATTGVSGYRAVGGLVGFNASTIDNAHATGLVNGSYLAGGLAGVNAGTVTGVYATGNVNGQHNIGGLVGSNSNSTGTATIDNAYATGSIGGTTNVGGLVGQNTDGTISNAYATGNVTGGIYVGGLVGDNNGSNAVHIITNAYATGNVSGSYVGGLVGSNGGTISNTYATGKVTPSTNNGFYGGLVGVAGGTVHNSYWDTTTYGSTNVGSGAGTGLTTAQLAAALPSGFTSSNWANIGNQTTPYLLANTSFGTVSGSVLLGTDTSATPAQYKVINSLTQLQNINSTGLGLNYVLGNDIDASATSTWNGGRGFAPIGNNLTGTSASRFTGIFDGLGYNISNLTINQLGGAYVGLLGYTSNAAIRNIGLVNASVSGSFTVGALVGLDQGGTIDNAYATGSVISSNYAGGLVGINTGTISNAYASVSVNGGSKTGGLVGLNGGSIVNAYATGSVIGNGSGAVVGGLVGLNGTNGTITNTYAAGSVSGGHLIGALVGSNSNTSSIIGNSYWDTSTGIAIGIGADNGTVNGGGGLTSAQMMQQSSFTGFDFSSPVWVIYNGHTAPLLNVFLTPLTVTASSQSQTYTGSTFGLLSPSYSIAGADTSGYLFGALSDAYNGAVNVGTYSPDLWSDQQGYRITYVGGALTITPKALTLSGLSAANKVYDGSTVASISDWGNLIGVVGSDAVNLLTSGSSASFADANAGTGQTVTVGGLVLGGSAAGNYTLLGTQTTTADITPKALTLSGLSASNKAYDGSTATSISGWGSLNGIVGSDAVSLLTSGSSASFADANAGTGKTVTVGGLALGGSAAGNYTLLGTQTTIADITPKALTLAGLTASNKVYDGSTAASISGWGSLNGIVGSDAVSLLTSGSSASFADANAGTGKTVTVGGLVLGGGAAGNYTLIGTQTSLADITPAPLTASLIGAISKPYDGTTDATLGASNFQLDGFVAGQGASVAQTDGQYASASIGSGIAVNASLSAGDFSANAGTLLSNYLLPTSASGLGRITASAAPPSLTGASGTAGQSVPWGYAGANSFALALDPRLQMQQTAPGKSTAVRLLVSADGNPLEQPPCAGHRSIDPFAAPAMAAGSCSKH